MRRVVRALLALVAALVVVVGPGGVPAGAHTALVRSTPAAGSVVPADTGRVQLEFSVPVLSRLAEVRVEDTAGHDRVVGSPATFDRVVVARVGGLRAGAHRVVYRVVAADGHPVVGSLRFTVAPGARSAAAPVAAPGDGTDGPAGTPWRVPVVGVLVAALLVVVRLGHARRAVVS